MEKLPFTGIGQSVGQSVLARTYTQCMHLSVTRCIYTPVTIISQIAGTFIGIRKQLALRLHQAVWPIRIFTVPIIVPISTPVCTHTCIRIRTDIHQW